MLQQHRAGDNATFIPNQIFKNLKLSWEQLDFSAATAYCSRDEVECEVADAQHGLREDCGAAPSQSFHAGQQFRKGKWLDHVVVTASSQASHAIIDFAQRTNDQGGSDNAIFPQALDYLDTVYARQHTIDCHYGIRRGTPAP
jgi:hypothetical protein